MFEGFNTDEACSIETFTFSLSKVFSIHTCICILKEDLKHELWNNNDIMEMPSGFCKSSITIKLHFECILLVNIVLKLILLLLQIYYLLLSLFDSLLIFPYVNAGTTSE